MSRSSSTQSSRENSPILDDLLNIFKNVSTNDHSNDNFQEVQYYEGIPSSSTNTLRAIRESYEKFRKFRIGKLQLDDENLVVDRDHALITFDEIYFPKATEVVINPMHSIHDMSSFNISLGETYKCITIHQYSVEYSKIQSMITNKSFIIRSIEEIYNPFLKRSYQLKKKQKEEQFPFLEEMQLFHGTKMENIDNICKNNLNWRLCGTRTGHRFGQGVSFSCNAMYAAAYSHDASEKVMILFNVLVGKTCAGTKDMKLPPNGYDTTLKNATDHIVVVKYEENEFYPAYKIKFHIAPGYTPQKNKNNNHSRRGRVQHNSFSFDFDDLDFYFD